jgi:hypothetical protein
LTFVSAPLERPTAYDPAVDLLSTDFNDAQARAIVKVTHESVERAAADLRSEFARWHAYLAIYLLAQIGIALLALVLVVPLDGGSPISRHRPADLRSNLTFSESTDDVGALSDATSPPTRSPRLGPRAN